MRVGVQYYRIPNPERRYWREDFERMPQLGVSLARFWIYWSAVNPAPGTWDWAALDELWALSDEFGVGVVGQLIPESHPRWFVERHSDLVPRAPDGSRAQLLGHTIAAASAYPGITFEHPAARQGMADFISAVVGRYAGHSATHSWDVWNEIQPFSISYDARTTQAWQHWLTSRFDSVGALREFTQLDVADFESVPLVREDLPDRGSGTLNLRYLFREWKSDRMIEEMGRRADVVRQLDRAHDVVSHRRGVTFLDPVVDEAKFSTVLDLWGTSNYGSEVTTARPIAELGLKLALARGVSGPKPFWLAETTAGRMYHLYGHTLPTGADIRTCLMMAFAHGAQSTLLWQFRHERFGQEVGGFGLLDFDGGTNDRVEAVAQVTAAIDHPDRTGESWTRQAASVALIYDPRTLWVERSMDQPIEQSVSIADELLGWYVASHQAGHSPEVLTPTAMAMHGISPRFSVVIAPMNILGDDAFGKRIIDWVRAGGTYVETAFSGMLDADLIAPVEVPAGALGAIQSGRVVARTYPSPHPGLAIGGARIPGAFVDEVIVPKSGDRGAATNVAITDVGAGRIVHLGSLPGVATLQGDRGLSDWVSSLVQAASEGVPIAVDPGVTVERIFRDDTEAILAFNENPSTATIVIEPAVGAGTIQDVFAAQPQAWNGPGRFEFAIAPGDCRWIELRGTKR
jgi:beta-galactosidase